MTKPNMCADCETDKFTGRYPFVINGRTMYICGACGESWYDDYDPDVPELERTEMGYEWKVDAGLDIPEKRVHGVITFIGKGKNGMSVN